MIELKQDGAGTYGIYDASHQLLKQAATWQVLDAEARALAKRNGDLYRRVEPVTPHNTNTIPATSRIRCAVAGDIAVTFDGDDADTAVVLATVAANREGIACRVDRVRVTATTADDIEALYDEDFR